MMPDNKTIIPDASIDAIQLSKVEGTPEAEDRPIHFTRFKAIVVKHYECTKVKYNSFRDAQAILNCVKHPRRYAKGRKAGRRVGKKDMRPQRSYKCEICGYWHLTSQPDLNDE